MMFDIYCYCRYWSSTLYSREREMNRTAFNSQAWVVVVFPCIPLSSPKNPQDIIKWNMVFELRANARWKTSLKSLNGKTRKAENPRRRSRLQYTRPRFSKKCSIEGLSRRWWRWLSPVPSVEASRTLLRRRLLVRTAVSMAIWISSSSPL